MIIALAEDDFAVRGLTDSASIMLARAPAPG